MLTKDPPAVSCISMEGILPLWSSYPMLPSILSNILIYKYIVMFMCSPLCLSDGYELKNSECHTQSRHETGASPSVFFVKHRSQTATGHLLRIVVVRGTEQRRELPSGTAPNHMIWEIRIGVVFLRRCGLPI